MMIDIDKLTEPELVDLNHRIVERLRFFQQMRAHRQMLDFKIGDWVTFAPEGHGTIRGMLTRYNKKSVTVHRGRWPLMECGAVTFVEDRHAGARSPEPFERDPPEIGFTRTPESDRAIV